MKEYSSLKPESVFRYFAEIAKIPRGSGNMKKISAYCLDFAKRNSLEATADKNENVIIRKPASQGYEDHAPIILQGHLDMVCQKTQESSIDFDTDGLEIYADGDFLKAKDTTLGADNGIAVAMIMSVLEDKSLSHPPIEAVFTTDEEVGMLGAKALDFSLFKGTRMINLDAEEEDTVTVSCAGGSDFQIFVPIERVLEEGQRLTIELRGLKGGHSGVEIDKGRVNAAILAGRVLSSLKNRWSLISISGGDKANAIIPYAKIELLSPNPDALEDELCELLAEIKTEIKEREPDFEAPVWRGERGSYEVLMQKSRDGIVKMLILVPNGVVEMSASIEKLVETSLNLGILNTEKDRISAHYTLRSNKQSALRYLERRLFAIAGYNGWESKAFGHYPAWEYKGNSELERLYTEIFEESLGYRPNVSAIHAGLECGVFAAGIEELECIAIGPWMYDVHTVNERVSISSVKKIYSLLTGLISKL